MAVKSIILFFRKQDENISPAFFVNLSTVLLTTTLFFVFFSTSHLTRNKQAKVSQNSNISVKVSRRDSHLRGCEIYIYSSLAYADYEK